MAGLEDKNVVWQADEDDDGVGDPDQMDSFQQNGLKADLVMVGDDEDFGRAAAAVGDGEMVPSDEYDDLEASLTSRHGHQAAKRAPESAGGDRVGRSYGAKRGGNELSRLAIRILKRAHKSNRLQPTIRLPFHPLYLTQKSKIYPLHPKRYLALRP